MIDIENSALWFTKSFFMKLKTEY